MSEPLENISDEICADWMLQLMENHWVIMQVLLRNLIITIGDVANLEKAIYCTKDLHGKLTKELINGNKETKES